MSDSFLTRCIHSAYTKLLKPMLFMFDPEDVHDTFTVIGEFLGRFAFTRSLTRAAFSYEHPALTQTVCGIEFKNPIGLAAGFDKDAHLTRILPAVGFGFEEVGSITGEACLGNPRPRLSRLKKSQSLLVYYGLKNDGIEAIAPRLARTTFDFPLGISLAKTNSPATVDEAAGIADYTKVLRIATEYSIGDYYTVNISCPNAYGGEPFTEPHKLDRLLASLRTIQTEKPLFVKLAPEISEEMLDDIIEVCRKHHIAGFISSNLAKDRSNPQIKEPVGAHGGMSGKIQEELSTAQIRYLYKKTRGEFVLIGCGGIFTAEDAYRKIRAGATLLQLITGMVYEGPQVVGSINRDLVALLTRDGYTTIHDAVGVDVE